MAEEPHAAVGAFDTEEALTEAVRTLATGTESALDEVEHLPADELFSVLANPGRRYVLTYLLQCEEDATCGELVDHVVAATDHATSDSAFRTRVATELTHAHLPKLGDAGLVDYDVERQVVSRTARTPLVRPYLRLALAQERLCDDSHV